LRLVGGVGQSSFRSLDVQFNQFFNALKSFVGQTEKGFHGGFLRGHNLFSGQHIQISGELKNTCLAEPDDGLNQQLLRCNIKASIGVVGLIASLFCCAAAF
jgi:hypothetical protein